MLDEIDVTQKLSEMRNSQNVFANLKSAKGNLFEYHHKLLDQEKEGNKSYLFSFLNEDAKAKGNPEIARRFKTEKLY